MFRIKCIQHFLLCIVLSLAAFIHARMEYARYTHIMSHAPQGMVLVRGLYQGGLAHRDGYWVADIDVESYTQEQHIISWTGTLRTKIYGPQTLVLTPGMHLEFIGRVSQWNASNTPGTFNGALYSFAQHLHGRLVVESWDDVDISSTTISTSHVSHWIAYLRDRIQHLLIHTLNTDAAASLLALLVGNTMLLSEEQKETYRAVGAGHLLAVSGLQITALVPVVYFICDRLLWLCFYLYKKIFSFHSLHTIQLYCRRYIPFISSSLILALYVLLCESPSSAVRAALMGFLTLIARIQNNCVHMYHLLCFTMMVHLLCVPVALFDWGFWLSYGALWGTLLGSNIRLWDTTQNHHSHSASYKNISWIQQLLFSSMGASVLLAPLSMTAFGGVPWCALWVNMVLVPLASVLQLWGLILGMVGCLVQSSWIIHAAASCASILEWLCAVYLEYGWLAQHTYVLSIDFAILICVLLLIVFDCLIHRRYFWIISSIITLFLLFWNPFVTLRTDRIRLDVLPVGQGDATLVTFPSGEVMLIDGGGALFTEHKDAQQLLLTWLQILHVRKIDVMVLSHPHPDHYGGLSAVAEKYSVKEFWSTTMYLDAPFLQPLVTSLQKQNTRFVNTPDLVGVHRFGESTVAVLGPYVSQHESYFDEWHANDNSLVLLLQHREKTALWAGDIEEMAEEHLLSRLSMTVDIVKAPHHGSRTSSTHNFVMQLRPDDVVFCTGENNLFKFPHPQVVDRYRKMNARIHNTADGLVRFYL